MRSGCLPPARQGSLRSACACLTVNDVGKPCAGEPHARFDVGRWKRSVVTHGGSRAARKHGWVRPRPLKVTPHATARASYPTIKGIARSSEVVRRRHGPCALPRIAWLRRSGCFCDEDGQSRRVRPELTRIASRQSFRMVGTMDPHLSASSRRWLMDGSTVRGNVSRRRQGMQASSTRRELNRGSSGG